MKPPEYAEHKSRSDERKRLHICFDMAEADILHDLLERLRTRRGELPAAISRIPLG